MAPARRVDLVVIICGSMAERIPHAKLKIFKNCGHAVAVDAHDAYIKLIKRFLYTDK